MEEVSTPTPAHHFDLIERSFTEAERFLKALGNPSAQFATDCLTQFAQQERETREMFAPLLEDFRRTDAMRSSIIQEFERSASRRQFDLISRSLVEAAAAKASFVDGLTSGSELRELMRTVSERTRESHTIFENFLRHQERQNRDARAFFGPRNSSMANWVETLRKTNELSGPLFQTPQASRDLCAAADKTRNIREQFEAGMRDLYLSTNVTTHALPGMEEAIRQMDFAERESLKPLRWTPPLVAPRPHIIERERHFIWVFGFRDENDYKSAESPETGNVGVFSRRGRSWQMGIGGDTQRVPHCGGFAYIAYALARPGEQLIHREVFDAVAGNDVSEVTRPDKAKLDPRAMTQIRAKRDELKAKFAEAEECGLLERAEKMRAEIEALEDRLSADLGLGGRSREFPDRNRKAKDSVVRAIKRALDRLAEDHSALYDHLSDSLTLTPLLCYQPSTPVDWEL